MRIKLEGMYHAPSWETVQDIIRTAYDESAVLTRISRDDGGANYRAHGEYTLTVATQYGEDVTLKLTVR